MDHLGNVRATFGRDLTTNDLIVYGYTDYYPFGSPLPGRNQISSPQYEHGYQGQFTLKDEETGLDAFELRMWDSRLARWTSTDPYGQFHSPYLGIGNDPINGIDPDGGWSWVGAGIGAGVGYAATGDWKGAVAGGVGGGLLGQGIANKLKGNPWACQNCPNLGNKITGGGSGYLAKGGSGFVSDSYIANLH